MAYTEKRHENALKNNLWYII